MVINKLYKYTKVSLFTLLVVVLYGFSVSAADAATIRAYPSTGVYSVGSPFTVSVVLNTGGQSVNAADGQIRFNPKELQVVSASRAGSIFNLWTQEPTYSNAAGTVSFGGGSPSGYKGSSGTVFRIVFRALGAGTPKVTFQSGSVLAADGLGTNILTSMNGGTYTISAVTTAPEPEYIAPANTPQAPSVTSLTHPDEEGWSKETDATLTWTVPNGITGIRTLLSDSPGTIPTIVYDEIITEKTIEDLDEGVSYFHIQFKNSDGWGRVTHYRLGVDSKAPENLEVFVEESMDPASPGHILKFTYEDTSPLTQYKVQLNGQEFVVYEDEDGSGQILIEPLAPGEHTVVVEAFDAAGNSAIASQSFIVQAFEKPIFTEYPTRINTEVIPAIKGTTRAESEVAVTVRRESTGQSVFGEAEDGTPKFSIRADNEGNFIYIPPESFEPGVYLISAVAKDKTGKLSEVSDELKLIVEVPGYIVFGSMVINVLSVVIPFIALLLLLVFGILYLRHKFKIWRGKVRKETGEAVDSLAKEFGTMVSDLNTNIETLTTARRGKLTKAEKAFIVETKKGIKKAQANITKEVGDIDELVN